MASAPATGSASTKEVIKRVLVVIGEKREKGNSESEKGGGGGRRSREHLFDGCD